MSSLLTHFSTLALPNTLHGNFSCQYYQWPPCCQTQSSYVGLYFPHFLISTCRGLHGQLGSVSRTFGYPPMSLTMPLTSILPLQDSKGQSCLGFSPGPLRVLSLLFIFHARFPVNPNDLAVGLNETSWPLCLPVYWLEYEKKGSLCVAWRRKQCVVLGRCQWRVGQQE